MRIQLQSQNHRGSILLVCLGSAFIIGTGIASYLALVENQNLSVAHSQAWNNSMVTAEAGIEEGLALINKYIGTGTSFTSWPNTAAADGWTPQSGNVYYLHRNLGAGFYDVYITNANPAAPTIKSTGTASWAHGSATNISRAVLVVAGSSSPFQGALLVKKGITLSGSLTVDSFNSQNPLYSSNGLYVAGLHEAHGSIMTDASNVVLTTEITTSGNNHVYGHIYTGPNDSILSSGTLTVGDTNFAGPGIQSGWSNSTANILIPDAPAIPSAAWFSMPAINNGTYVLDGGGSGHTNYYQTSSGFSVSGNNTILVTNGNVVLDFVGSFSLSGNSAINVASNASLVAWFIGNPTVSGNDVVNLGGYARNVTFYGTANCTSITYSGSHSFIGTIYAPYASITWSGSGAVCGSVVANSFNNSGGASIHYDESLQGQISAGYVVNSWQEVPP